MEGMELGQKTGEYLFTQGVLGVMCALLIAVCVYLERQRRLAWSSAEKKIEALNEKHQIELAAEQKFAREQQELRFIALQSANDSQGKAVELTQMLIHSRSGSGSNAA